MFNFNTKQFDFNSVLENKKTTYALSLDDFDDEEFDNSQSSQTSHFNDIIDAEIDFRIFLKANVFNPINVDIDIKSSDDKNAKNKYAWKSYSDKNGNKHFLAYIDIVQERLNKQYEYDIYVDLNTVTNELHIGNCTTYAATKFLNIGYPLIKICEHYINGPVYIGCIHIDKPFSTKATAKEILNTIETPLNYLSIKEDVSFWRSVWNGIGYYLPSNRPGMVLTDIEEKLKLTPEFINHFNGFDSKISSNIKVALFYNMFNSFDDFAKITKIFCDANVLLYVEFGIEMSKLNYNEKIIEFENKLNEKLGIALKKKQNLDASENIAKNYFYGILPQNVIEHFESINQKAPNLLSVKTMAKERKSKDPYRKLDLPVVKLILKDNGIDVDKIVNDYEQQWLSTFYKFANIFYKHLKQLKVNNEKDSYDNYNEYNYIIDNLFEYNRFTIKYHDENNDLQTFDAFEEFTEEEILLLQDIVFGLKPNLEFDKNDPIIDTNKLDDPNDECIFICKRLLSEFGNYSIRHTIGENVTNHVYNEFLIIQRFIYLFYKQYVNDYNTNIDEDKALLQMPDINILYDMTYNSASYGYYNISTYFPFNFGDIYMKLNTYNQLYKFLTFISYIIENGYNITHPNTSAYRDPKQRLIRLYLGLDIIENIEDINKLITEEEFSLNNNPNVKLLGIDSIIKMFSIIFTNIDKKL